MITRLAGKKSSSARKLLLNSASRRGIRSVANGQRQRTLPIVSSMNGRMRLSQQILLYSTEKIVQLRSGKTTDMPKTLYNGRDESENCGVGLIASLKSTPSRRIVVQADEMLVRMAHRGGCGCDPASGDGSGE